MANNLSQLKAKYSPLHRLLVSGNWQEADLETTRLTFRVDSEKLKIDDGIPARREIAEIIDKFPIQELKLIDFLWKKYSNRRFGFSVQWQIFQEITAAYYNPDLIEKYLVNNRWSPMSALAIEIGWLNKGAGEWAFDRDIIYSLDAPLGHLPTVGRQEMGVAFHHGYMLSWIFSKLYPRNTDY